MHLAWFGGGILLLTVTTIGIARWARVGLGWFPLWAMLRAVVQLSVVALLLRGVLAVPLTVVAFLVLMLATATGTASGRLRETWHGRRAAAAGVLVGGTTATAAVFALRLVPLEARYLVAGGGIVIGNAMSAATLTGRGFQRSARTRAAEIEAWFALGATPAEAHDEIGREAVRESLLPTLDQTKSTGLVTLPGAFVGALFGGASPLVAAQFQLVVLAAIALAMLLTALVVARVVGRSPYVVVAG